MINLVFLLIVCLKIKLSPRNGDFPYIVSVPQTISFNKNVFLFHLMIKIRAGEGKGPRRVRATSPPT